MFCSALPVSAESHPATSLRGPASTEHACPCMTAVRVSVVLCCAVAPGPEDDRKAKVAWRQEKAAEEKRLAQER